MTDSKENEKERERERHRERQRNNKMKERHWELYICDILGVTETLAVGV